MSFTTYSLIPAKKSDMFIAHIFCITQLPKSDFSLFSVSQFLTLKNIVGAGLPLAQATLGVQPSAMLALSKRVNKKECNIASDLLCNVAFTMFLLTSLQILCVGFIVSFAPVFPDPSNKSHATNNYGLQSGVPNIGISLSNNIYCSFSLYAIKGLSCLENSGWRSFLSDFSI